MKRVCLILAAVMILGIIPGCGQGGSGKNGVEIVVVTPFDSGDGNRDNFVNAYKAYEAATGNTVRDEASASNEEWKAKVMADFEAGKEPDVLFYFVGADADKLVESGKLVPISDIRREYPDYAANMKDSMMPVSTSNGRQYAVPVNGYWEGLFVNKKVLEACGVTIPGADYTWDKFLEDCETIKAKGYVPIACSLAEIPHYWFEFCTFNHGNITNHLTLPANSSDEAGGKWVAGLMDIKSLYDRDFFPENTLTAPDGETSALMLENKAAFLLDGSWQVGWLQANAEDIGDFMVTCVPAKGERKPTDIIGGLSMGYYITRKAWNDLKKREACVEFVKAMTTDEVVSSFGALSVTALRNGTKPPEDADPLVMSVLAMTKYCTSVVPAAQDMLVPAARKALFADVKNIVIGEISPEAAIDNCLAIK